MPDEPKKLDGRRNNKLKRPNEKVVHDVDLQTAQATLMLAKRIMGQSMTSISQEFGVSDQVVARRLKLAKRAGLLTTATDKVLEELVVLAHETYKLALKEGDVEAARDVMFGTGILSKNNKPQIAPESQEMTLAVWRESRASGFEKPTVETVPIEGEVIDEPIL